MERFIALLRGINVGGKNTIKMAELKDSLKRRGLHDVVSYINSGNILFSSEQNEAALKTLCETVIEEDFALDIPVCIISANELREAIRNAPEWWNRDKDARHDANFVIPPLKAAKLVAHIGAIKEEYERLDFRGRVVFWSAPLATYSRTRWPRIVGEKALYHAVTTRNANTTLKLLELSGAAEVPATAPLP
jgi:uncharacterized protein (DUF1697 family)